MTDESRKDEHGIFGNRPSPKNYSNINDGMCLAVLSGLSGNVLTASDIDNQTPISIAHAVTAIKAAFESGRTNTAGDQPSDMAMPISFEYTNYRGETTIRRGLPISFRWGTTDWHKEEGYLFKMLDLDKGEIREFALKDCDFTKTDTTFGIVPTAD